MPVPPKWSGQDKRFGETVKNNLDVLCGYSGNPLDRAITARDLLDSGIVKLAAGSSIFSGSSSGLAPISSIADYDTPPAPTSLAASGAFENILLTWNLEAYRGHAYTEVYRHTSDVIADAALAAQVSGLTGIYSDFVGSGADYYYWVRAVNENGIKGPFNSSTGTRGQTAPDVEFLLETLEDAITSSQLAQDLTTQLQGYDDDIADLVTTFGTTVSAATSAAAAAASESAAIAAEASALGASASAVSAQTAAIGAETGAVAAQAAAILAQTNAESAETDAIAAKVAALLAQTNAETAESNAETAETNAETAQSAAETAQTAASTSATGAAGSAASATNSQTAAANSATAAGNSASAAATSESNASTFATNAGTGATASQNSRLAADMLVRQALPGPHEDLKQRPFFFFGHNL